MIIVRTQNNIT